VHIEPLRLPGTHLITYRPNEDARGHFVRTYDEETFRRHGLTTSWVQGNQSLSTQKGIIRGLHFQRPPHAETKLVRVAAGRVWDVFVDLRRDSATFGHWDAVELSASELRAVYIPPGFAHGFCTLSEETLVLYQVDSAYAPEAEGGIRWNDPDLGITWPVDNPVVSEKDSRLPLVAEWTSPFQI